eukprot:gene2670-2709_t
MFKRLTSILGSTEAELRKALALIESGERAAAFKLLARAAQAGLPEAEYQIARSYLEGAGVPGSGIEGLRWLERSAAKDFAPAQALLAAFYLQGVPTGGPDAAPGDLGATSSLFNSRVENLPPDFEKAAHWARKGAEGGSPEAQALLGFLLVSGPESMRDEAASEAIYKRAAEAKSPQGLLGYGLAILKRATQHDDFVTAISYLKPAAEAGLGTAMFLMGALTEQGQGIDADLTEAAAHYERAASLGVRTAQTRFGLALLNGRGVEADPVLAESWLRRAAMQGDADAAAVIGQLYARQGGVEANMAEAAIWLRRAAEGGHAQAARALGAMHMTGNGVAKDPAEAARWFRAVASTGDVQSRYDLATLVLQGQASAEDSQSTAEWFKSEAEKGDNIAAFNYGVCLAEGIGAERNEAEAIQWLRRAAETVVNAQYWYGRLLAEGRGGPENLTEARVWIGKAAEAGVTDAQVALAEMFVNGRGGPRNHGAAIQLFRRAANQGHVGAMYALGAMYGGGHDVMWDRKAAQHWFQAAAERGHGHAQMMLGRYLARGLAGIRDRNAARTWFAKAVASGVAEAQPHLDALPAADEVAKVETVSREDAVRADAERACEIASGFVARGDLTSARAWLDRARRIMPDDPGVALALAGVLLQQGQPGAEALLIKALTRADTSELWLTLAAAHLKAGNREAARNALARLLSGHVLIADPATITVLANLACDGTGIPGWSAATRTAGETALRWHASVEGAEALVDGVAIPPGLLPESGISLTVRARGIQLLGSPIDLRALLHIEGVVAAAADGIQGWAWCPQDVAAAPRLTITSAKGRSIVINADDDRVPTERPMSRPRGFFVPMARLAHMQPPLRVIGADGAELLGSPLDPWPIALAARAKPVPAAYRGPMAEAPCEPGRPVAILIPAYRNLALTRQCLDSVFATTPPNTPVIVVNDASPERALSVWLDEMAASGSIILIRHETNRGFPASANAGLEAAFALSPPHDAVLLNSDTLLPSGKPPSWLRRLQDCVHGAPDIGSATPLSNDASILSYPARDAGNSVPTAKEVAGLDDLARAANARKPVEIPTGVGFCLYLRRECALQGGLFRTDLFAQGYGEENDFCIRTRHLGWRHMAAPNVFVGHVSHASFGEGRLPLMRRNLAVLEQLHPGYRALIADYQQPVPAQDALAPARRRIDSARWAKARRRSAVILVSHASGGGVDKLLLARAAEIAADGHRCIILRPVTDPERPSETLHGLCQISDAAFPGLYPNLVFDLRHERADMVRLLKADRPVLFEVHHRLGHDPEILNVARALALPIGYRLHDYAAFCPRITLFGARQTYCGEPIDVAACEVCVAEAGNRSGETIGVAALRQRSASEFAEASSVAVPSADMAGRLRRYFPTLRCAITPNETELPPRPPPPRSAVHRRVAVIGGITIEKGFNILLDCARDAAAQSLPLDFVLVGHSTDDALLFETGRVFVTGRYTDDEAEALIRAQEADLAFLPSVVPESWSFTLSLAWRAGLRTLVFDIGAQAARVKATGYGAVLPLGLPPAIINQQLLRTTGEMGR